MVLSRSLLCGLTVIGKMGENQCTIQQLYIKNALKECISLRCVANVPDASVLRESLSIQARRPVGYAYW